MIDPKFEEEGMSIFNDGGGSKDLEKDKAKFCLMRQCSYSSFGRYRAML